MPAATPRPESQEDILDAALAALTDADILPDEDARAVPDPNCGRPDELAAIVELARRRPASRATTPVPPGQLPVNVSEFLSDEVAMALTLTRRGGEVLVSLAIDLACRRGTAAALEAGRIDLGKARVILDGVSTLAEAHAAAVEAAVLPIAPGLTTGELRAEVARMVLAADPDAARKQRQEDEKHARVECWVNPTGTANLAGRYLPSAQALVADKRLCRIAAGWKKQIRAAWKHADPHGQQPRPEHGTDLLRARAYLMLLLGQPVDTPPADLLPPADNPAPGDRPGGADSADRDRPARAGTGHPDRNAPDGGPGSTDCPDDADNQDDQDD